MNEQGPIPERIDVPVPLLVVVPNIIDQLQQAGYVETEPTPISRVWIRKARLQSLMHDRD